MTVEEWRDIEDYKGFYQVSNLGRVRSLPVKNKTKRLSGKVLVKMSNNSGYELVNLSRKIFYVHRLVAKAFIENPNDYPCVNHKDENKANNIADNLEWCTHKYNSNYGTRKERIALNESRKIVQYDLSGNKIKEWISATEAARYYGVRRWTISGCCAGRQHTSCGYKWGYADECK